MDPKLKIILENGGRKNSFIVACQSILPRSFYHTFFPPPSAGISHFSPIFPQPHMSNISFSYKQGAHFIQGFMESHEIFSRFFSHSSWFVMKIAKKGQVRLAFFIAWIVVCLIELQPKATLT